MRNDILRMILKNQPVYSGYAFVNIIIIAVDYNLDFVEVIADFDAAFSIVQISSEVLEIHDLVAESTRQVSDKA